MLEKICRFSYCEPLICTVICEQVGVYSFYRPRLSGVIPWGPAVDDILEVGKAIVRQVLESQRTPLVSLLLRGNPGCGKTALAAHLAKQCNFPFVKVHTHSQSCDTAKNFVLIFYFFKLYFYHVVTLHRCLGDIP